jgi:hypothetical protein
MCGDDYGAKDIKDLWDRMPEDHWIKDLFTEVNFVDEGRLLNILRPYSYVTINDIFKWLDDIGFTLVRFADEHLWIPDFWNLQPLYKGDKQKTLIEGFDRSTVFQIIEGLRGQLKKLEFFIAPHYEGKKWREEKLMTTPFGAITGKSFVFYDGTRMEFDGEKMMVLRMLTNEPCTLSEVKDEIREMFPQMIDQFIQIMFRLGVII